MSADELCYYSSLDWYLTDPQIDRRLLLDQCTHSSCPRASRSFLVLQLQPAVVHAQMFWLIHHQEDLYSAKWKPFTHMYTTLAPAVTFTTTSLIFNHGPKYNPNPKLYYTIKSWNRLQSGFLVLVLFCTCTRCLTQADGAEGQSWPLALENTDALALVSRPLRHHLSLQQCKLSPISAWQLHPPGGQQHWAGVTMTLSHSLGEMDSARYCNLSW